MNKKIIAVMMMVLILASVVVARYEGVTLSAQVTDCSATSTYACMKFPGTKGYALILARADAGQPVLYWPTQSGTIATEERVAALIAAAQPSPTPVPSPLPSPSPSPSVSPRLLEPRVETWPSLAADKQALLTKMDQAGYKLVQVIGTSAIFERKQ